LKVCPPSEMLLAFGLFQSAVQLIEAD
jgi:hypothetical protein